LLEEEVDETIIQAFMSLIANHGPEERLMNFFASICTVQSNPIKSNQEECLNLLFLDKDNYGSMFLHTFEDPSPGVKRVPWKLSKFSDEYPEEFLGKSVLDDGGFKPVMVSWASMKSMKGRANGGNLLTHDFVIDGEQVCEVTEFCKYVSKTSAEMEDECFTKFGDNDTFDSEDESEDESSELPGRRKLMLQWELSQYYVAQIKVFANMCQGRSYNCIAHLSKAFPYAMLMHLVSNDKLAYEVRTAFCMLLQVLWVDRYPHAPNCGRPSLPNLVWVYNDLKKTNVDEEGALLHFSLGDGHPCLDLEFSAKNYEFLSMKSHTKFFLLRDFLVGWLASLNGAQTIGDKSKNGKKGSWLFAVFANFRSN
jgi:hypothetical protein